MHLAFHSVFTPVNSCGGLFFVHCSGPTGGTLGKVVLRNTLETDLIEL